MTTLVVGIGIGLVAGVLSGLFGIGGGVIIVPVLVYIGFAQREATGTSLAALVAPVGLLGVIEYARRHEIRVPYAVGIAIGLVAGVLIGAKVAGRTSNATLQRLFGVVLLAASVRFLLFSPK